MAAFPVYTISALANQIVFSEVETSDVSTLLNNFSMDR